MEPLTPAKRLTAIAAGIVLAAGAGVAIYREVARQPLAKLVRADLPLLELTVKLRDSANQDLDAANSLVGSNDEVPAGDERCPALVGGDTGSATAVDVSVKRPANCPKRAAWYVASTGGVYAVLQPGRGVFTVVGPASRSATPGR